MSLGLPCPVFNDFPEVATASAEELLNGIHFAKRVAPQTRKERMPEFHTVNAQLYDKQFDNRIRKKEGDYHVGRTYHTTAGTLDERCRRTGGYARDLRDILECP